MTEHPVSDEHGFSLIELMVVVVIIAVLIGIAIPVFLGLRSRADDTAAKQGVVLSVRTAAAFGQAAGIFEGVTTASLNAAEPSLTFVDGTDPSTGPTVVSQLVVDAGAGDSVFVASVLSSSGTCFMARHQVAGTDYAQAEVADCKASDHLAMVFGPSW